MNDTICALSTAQGLGAIAMIRVSGSEAISIFNKMFKGIKGQSLDQVEPYSLHFGKILDGNYAVDEVMVGVFKAPRSYTGENVVEITCHGSTYIQQQIIQLLLKNGCRMADPGEYTMRAYVNGKMDLSQAEAVADLIESENKASHQVAMQQMRGGFSKEIKELREELIQFASLIELELDFGEEDVEFANREQLTKLLSHIKSVVSNLLESFATGNVIKNGLPVAIVGAPNTGKSTLLNALLNEEKAIVTDIAGTTRDAIEDEVTISGIKFRFIDTAGIRDTTDVVESIGIEKTYEKLANSRVVLFLFSVKEFLQNKESILLEIEELKKRTVDKSLILLANKIDLVENTSKLDAIDFSGETLIPISAKNKEGIDHLKEQLLSEVNLSAVTSNQTIVTNARHAHALEQSLADIVRVEEGMAHNISGDLLAMDIREALKHLGGIVGEIDVDTDILGSIFGKFCIGK